MRRASAFAAVTLLLATPGQTGEPWLIRVRTTERTYAVREDGSFAKTLVHVGGQPSPNGAWLLSMKPQGAAFMLSVAKLTDAPQPALVSIPASEARWTADGQSVLYVSVATGRPQAYVVNVGDGVSRRLTDDQEGVRQPHQAVDGTLSYLALRWKKATREYATLSLNERLARKGTLDRVDLVVVKNGQPRTLVENVVIHDQALRPDGGAVAYGTLDGLVVAEVLGGSVRRYAWADIDNRLGPTHGIASLAWRGDGKALAFRTPFTGGRAASDHGRVFGDRECFVLTLETGQVYRFEIDASAVVDWL